MLHCATQTKFGTLLRLAFKTCLIKRMGLGPFCVCELIPSFARRSRRYPTMGPV